MKERDGGGGGGGGEGGGGVCGAEGSLHRDTSNRNQSN
jgi:hypothetical protein